MRAPTADADLVAGARDGSAVGGARHLEQRFVLIGGEILREDQLCLGSEVKRSRFAFVLRLVVDQVGDPNMAASVDDRGRERQQFARSRAGEELQVDEVANERPDPLAYDVDVGLI